MRGTSERLIDNQPSGTRRVALLGLIYQGIYAGTQLVGFGLLVRHVGAELFGLWMTLVAISSLLPLAMLGQHGILLTRVGSLAFQDPQATQRIFFTSATLVTGIALVLLTLLSLVSPVMDWGQLLKAGEGLTQPQVGLTAYLAIAVSLLSLPAIMGGHLIYALQRGDLVHQIMSVSCLASLLATALAIHWSQPLWVVGPVSLLGPLLGGLVLWLYGYLRQLIPLPPWEFLDYQLMHRLLAAGSFFAITDMMTLIILRTPDIIVAHLHGLGQVGPFAAIGRFPLLMLATFQAILLPYWPVISESAQRQGPAWIGALARRTLVLTLGIWALGAAAFWLFGPRLIVAWMGRQDFVDTSLIAMACLQALGLGLFAWLSVFLGALSRQRHLARAAAIAVSLFIPLAVLLGQFLGPVGVGLAQALALFLGAIPLAGWVLGRIVSSRPIPGVSP